MHESLNLAALYRLPVVFVCENNLYASHMHWSERRVARQSGSAPARSTGARQRWTATTSTAVYDAAQRRGRAGARGAGPSFLECRTFRWRGHVGASFGYGCRRASGGANSRVDGRDPIRRVAEQLSIGAGRSAGRAPMSTRKSPARWLAGAPRASQPDAHGARAEARMRDADLRAGDSRGARATAQPRPARVRDRAGTVEPVVRRERAWRTSTASSAASG